MTAADFMKQLPLLLLVGLSIGVFFGTLGVLVFGPVGVANRAACDKAVHLLLTTDSMVELERSKYLIRKLTCSVNRRLPSAGAEP